MGYMQQFHEYMSVKTVLQNETNGHTHTKTLDTSTSTQK